MPNLAGQAELQKLQIHLYEEPSARTLDLGEIASYLRQKLGPVNVDVRAAFIRASGREAERLAWELAKAKVRSLNDPDLNVDPLLGEVQYEKRVLEDPARGSTGVLYDGFKLQALLRTLLPPGEREVNHVHVIFTSRLFGTWDEGDRRYHARVSVYGFPSLVSTSGIVEAPAKPKEFYLLKHQYAALRRLDKLEELKREFRGRFVDYDDKRLTELMKGYVMQAVFYHLTLNPFCEDKRCRLYNAHWQEELLRAQLEPPEFCEHHERMLQRWKAQLLAMERR